MENGEKMKNALINAKLKALYDEYTPAFLSAWSDAFEEALIFAVMTQRTEFYL